MMCCVFVRLLHARCQIRLVESYYGQSTAIDGKEAQRQKKGKKTLHAGKINAAPEHAGRPLYGPSKNFCTFLVLMPPSMPSLSQSAHKIHKRGYKVKECFTQVILNSFFSTWHKPVVHWCCQACARPGTDGCLCFF
jgi:hypothetical protein